MNYLLRVVYYGEKHCDDDINKKMTKRFWWNCVGARRAAAPQIFTKLDLLLIDNDSERKK